MSSRTRRGTATIVAITPRLLLRRWTMDDVPAAAAVYGDAETMRYFGNGATSTREDLAAEFPSIIAAYADPGYGNYAVVERASGTVMGHCGVRYIAPRDRHEADCALHRRWWRQGYGLEALRAAYVRAFAVNGVTEIHGIAHRDNAASAALMRRLGMRPAETLLAHGVPSVRYMLARADFL